MMDPPVTTKRCCTACRLSVMPADIAGEATSDDAMSCKHCIYALAYGCVRRPQTDLVCILLADHIFGSTKCYGPPVAIAQLSSLADMTFKRRHPPSSTERNGAVAGFEFGRTAAGCDSSDPRRSCKPHVCHIGPFPPFAMRADSHSGFMRVIRAGSDLPTPGIARKKTRSRLAYLSAEDAARDSCALRERTVSRDSLDSCGSLDAWANANPAWCAPMIAQAGRSPLCTFKPIFTRCGSAFPPW